MTTVDTYEVKIFLGLREGYSNISHSYLDVDKVCQEFCDIESLCVTVTGTKFLYKDGFESGVVIGLINYPRFPKSNDDILKIAIKLATILKERFKQNRVSIVSPQKTIMIGEE